MATPEGEPVVEEDAPLDGLAGVPAASTVTGHGGRLSPEEGARAATGDVVAVLPARSWMKGPASGGTALGYFAGRGLDGEVVDLDRLVTRRDRAADMKAVLIVVADGLTPSLRPVLVEMLALNMDKVATVVVIPATAENTTRFLGAMAPSLKGHVMLNPGGDVSHQLAPDGPLPRAILADDDGIAWLELQPGTEFTIQEGLRQFWPKEVGPLPGMK